jgi:hypothetical protein
LFVARTEPCPETCHLVGESTPQRYKETERGDRFDKPFMYMYTYTYM